MSERFPIFPPDPVPEEVRMTLWPPSVEVHKVWGTEQHLALTELYTLKRMCLKRGYECSFHRHLMKDETFYMVEGVLALHMGSPYMDVFILRPGDSFRVRPGQYHSFCGLRASVFMEVSTYDSKEDSYRLTKSRKTPAAELRKYVDKANSEIKRNAVSWKEYERMRKDV